jgi:hypothetical protein
MTREGYKFGVAWIAENDSPGSADAQDAAVVAGYISTLLLADLFHKEPATVAQDIVRYRHARSN